MNNNPQVASCGHLVFVRANGNVVAHRDANGGACYTSEKPIDDAGKLASSTPMSAASETPMTFGHSDILCPVHLNLASKLPEYPQVYGCPQCAVNHIAELEELIAEMYRSLPGAARLRFNDSEAGRIFERANMEALRPAFNALAKHAEEQTVAASLPTQAEPQEPKCSTCNDTQRVAKVYGKDYDCELSTSVACPACCGMKGEA